MDELVKLFNDNDTHIEINTVNQKENGSTDNLNTYSYTVNLVNNKTQDVIESISIDKFDKKDIDLTTKNSKRGKNKLIKENE